ncbi:hypothetical protein ANN_03393 [Periplaneta americana]|uniref:Transposase n=1 Tax=Periplaneta americana TaxID=6978 RepID=A0ABQ8TZ04_PERAM|nr:hypothetical protein ANN_03393 [Periplaneta americana]
MMCVLVGHKQFELKIQEAATLVRANRSQSVDDIAATVGVSHGTCYKILSDDLNMSRVTQHSVQDQRDDRMTICGDLISSADDDPTFLNRIITGDETWCFLYDPQLKRQSATWKTPLSPRQKKPRQARSKGKVMLELFFDSNGIVHMEFIPEGATVNKTRYKEILGRLRGSIRHKRPELWRTKNWLLLHDNAPTHRSVLVQEELARQQVTILPHPLYSPDLAPCDFFLFPRMKATLRGRRFHSSEEVMTATREAIRDLPANIFQQCFQQLYQRWQTAQDSVCLLSDSNVGLSGNLVADKGWDYYEIKAHSVQCDNKFICDNDKCVNASLRGTAQTARYRDLLVQHVIPALQERNCDHTIIFTQDGATPHVARQVKDLLRETFSNDHIISRQFPDAWPSRSPDLNPCDFWLWGYLKDQGHIWSLPDLKASI